MPSHVTPGQSASDYQPKNDSEPTRPGRCFGRKVTGAGKPENQLNAPESKPLRAARSLSTRKARPASLSKAPSTSPQDPVAGRGKVQVLDNGRIEKSMAKWEVINYARIFQNPANSELAQFCPEDIDWQLASGEEVSLRNLSLDSPQYQSLLNRANADEFPVQMTNAAPSGKVLDIKLGDIISTTADSVHGKNNLKRNLKRAWHIFKQDTNSSGVTIQNHKGGVEREIDELRRDSHFLPLLRELTGFGALQGENLKSATAKLVAGLQDLKIAAENSQVGFVGASILVSCDDVEPQITLIDVENCVLPGDPGVDGASIRTKKDNFIRGLDTLRQQLTKAI